MGKKEFSLKRNSRRAIHLFTIALSRVLVLLTRKIREFLNLILGVLWRIV